MSRLFLFCILLIGACVITNLTGESGHAQEQKQTIIKITDPQDGTRVGRETLVKGTAYLPRGHYLWVLARRSDFEPLWWPQREAKVDPRTHEWSATAFFGESGDLGYAFDIGVISVNEEGHALLKDYLIKAMKTGSWMPVEIPPISSPPQIRRVKRVHQ
jgi:hypothetical protein